jgi:hypothetical protein
MSFILHVREKVAGLNRQQKYILNMDQTPVFYMPTGKTLNQVGKTPASRLCLSVHFVLVANNTGAGARSVNGRASTFQTIRATVAVTVTASGEMLQPMIIFKGKPGGRIKKTEFGTYAPNAVYACRGAARMDERVMRMWVEKVIKKFLWMTCLRILRRF